MQLADDVSREDAKARSSFARQDAKSEAPSGTDAGRAEEGAGMRLRRRHAILASLCEHKAPGATIAPANNQDGGHYLCLPSSAG
jgi:hypothetical protein